MLSALTFLPLAGALLIAFLPSKAVQLQRILAFAVTMAVAALGVNLYVGFDGSQAVAQHVLHTFWFSLPHGASTAGAQGVDVNFFLGVDGVSILLVTLTTVLMPLVVLSSLGHITHRVKEFLIWLLVMETGMLGVFLSLDIVLFYFFWEVSLVPLYFIVGIWGGDRRLYATIKFFLYTVAGSLVMLVAVIASIYHLGTSSIPALIDGASSLPSATQTWLFASFALAFAIKVPMLPFHTWLADAHTEAPTAGSVVLAGVLLKMGTYGLLRFGVEMFPTAAITYAPLFLALGGIGIVYGAFLAWAQTDLKRLIACSSVSHLGFCVIGLFAMTEAGLRGSVLQMVNHGLSTGLLFLLVGMIYERTHTRRLDRFGGIATVMPIFSFFFVFTVLSSAGLPGLNGFVGEYLILAGTFEASPFWAAISVTGVIFGAVYLLMATRRVLFGPLVHEENRELTDLGARELVTIAPLIVLCIWIGVAPNNFIHKSSGSLDHIAARVRLAQEQMRVSQLTEVLSTIDKDTDR